MIKLFDFLYYCLYRVFASIKREGEKDERLASTFYSILLSTNLMMILFVFKFIIPKVFFSNQMYALLLKGFLCCAFIYIYMYCKRYFLVNGNWKIIKLNFDTKFRSISNKVVIMFGVLYIVLTFTSFIGIALLLS